VVVVVGSKLWDSRAQTGLSQLVFQTLYKRSGRMSRERWDRAKELRAGLRNWMVKCKRH
jgi:hypothetical protein